MRVRWCVCVCVCVRGPWLTTGSSLHRRKQDPSEVGDMWPLVWNRFLRECKQSDVISLDGEAL